MRLSRIHLGLVLLPVVLWIAPLPVQAAPATEAEMNLYTRIAALNVCIARAADTDFDKAVAIAGETIAQVIQGGHQSQIAQVGLIRRCWVPLRSAPTRSQPM
ncbi:MAG: hypothetical protein O3C02_04230 [Cyanobacteria bacterium]|nr:hypothetical protein [Cyanobacteriota bacterium]